ncbi:peptidoglycan-binding protein [Hyphomicrobium methylovorum]|uniref:peptidoglycan-binding domain-containing protein n=1 Tax=Hyphomicrobium methylovorum TaxID=84 RepID=UPI0015E6EF3F|nr:peptidoglycan-binding domain-containing protein [Hyphomicrobium methylovorum]MBA2124692.1 peptidoglycan-binding protein [Hyphomicrobium methylovorum]
MTGWEQKLALVVALMMTLSVGVNMAVFQKRADGKAIETGGLPARASWIDGMTGGQNDSVAAPGAEAAGATSASSNQPDDTASVEITRGIQRELGTRGYEPGQADGVAGLVTRAAIFAYEYDNGLVLTGKPSEPLLSQIVLGSSSLEQNGARPGKSTTHDGEALIITVKQQLDTLGYQTGAAGGALTPELQRAIREFEADQKLKISGRISGPMMSRVIRLQAQGKAQRKPSTRTSSR